jgi:hypothetical protein
MTKRKDMNMPTDRMFAIIDNDNKVKHEYLFVINEDNCENKSKQFALFIEDKYPEIEIQFKRYANEIGGNLFKNGTKGWLESKDIDLWKEFKDDFFNITKD